MAGEWLALDIGLPDKPEVQELIDLTDQPVEVVVYRLFRLWGWASMHCTDGTARMTLPRLVRTCGGDEAFWRAVAAVGWLEIDQTAATVAVPGWDRRFSQAAKSRAQQSDRSRAHEERNPGRKRTKEPSDGAASDDPTAERRRGDKRILEVPPPPPRDASLWQEFRQAWNADAAAANRRPWTPPEPPEGSEHLFCDPEWVRKALDAVRRTGCCKYFKTPITLLQFVGPKFVQRINGGQYDEPKPAKAAASPDGRKTATESAEAWERRVADPERRRRRQEYEAAKEARKEAAKLAATLKIAEDT